MAYVHLFDPVVIHNQGEEKHAKCKPFTLDSACTAVVCTEEKKTIILSGHAMKTSQNNLPKSKIFQKYH